MGSVTIPFPIEDLFALAAAEGVEIVWYPHPEGPRGRYLIVADQPVILLSPSLRESPMRLRCTLAHELGHHVTGCSMWDPRDEVRADRWARELLLPEYWLLPRLWMTPGELAEEAGVYQLWVEARLRDIKYTGVKDISRAVACIKER